MQPKVHRKGGESSEVGILLLSPSKRCRRNAADFLKPPEQGLPKKFTSASLGHFGVTLQLQVHQLWYPTKLPLYLASTRPPSAPRRVNVAQITRSDAQGINDQVLMHSL